jgi:hypothetical protein
MPYHASGSGDLVEIVDLSRVGGKLAEFAAGAHKKAIWLGLSRTTSASWACSPACRDMPGTVLTATTCRRSSRDSSRWPDVAKGRGVSRRGDSRCRRRGSVAPGWRSTRAAAQWKVGAPQEACPDLTQDHRPATVRAALNCELRLPVLACGKARFGDLLGERRWFGPRHD